MKLFAKITLATAMAFIAAASLNAQPEHNDSLRTVTWSIYMQGGVSGFHNMKEVGDQYSFDKWTLAPAADVGVFLYPRPWIRFGLGGNYTYLKQADPGVQKYLETIPDFHLETEQGTFIGTMTNEGARLQNRNFTHAAGVDLTMGINFMEIWRERNAQWFNIWASAGAGYMHGWNTYTRTVAWDHTFVSNDGMFSKSSSEVVSPVEKHTFDSPYIPVGLSVEFDVIPQLSLALFGQYKFFPGNISHTPTGIWTAGAGIRINLVGKTQGFKNKQDRIYELEDQVRYYSSIAPRVDTVVVEVPVEKEVVEPVKETEPIPVSGKLQEVVKPLSHFAVQIYAFRIYQHAPDDKIFFNDNPTIYRNGDLRRYVVFTGTLDEAKIKLLELRTRYHDAFIVYIDDNGVVTPYVE